MFDPKTLLEALHAADVRFVLIGGMAATVQGSAHVTGDIDICYERTHANCKKIVESLAPFSPHLRGAPPGLPFQWDAETLQKGSNFTLSTEAGPVDILGYVSGLGEYDEVKSQAQTIELYDLTMWVLTLEGLIRSKEAAARTKDERLLPELRSLRLLRDEEAGETNDS